MTNTTIQAIEYLEANYTVGQDIELAAFFCDNGIMMAATMLEELTTLGILAVTHKGINVSQEVADYGYTYMGYEKAIHMTGALSDVLNLSSNILKGFKEIYYYASVNKDVTDEGIFNVLNAYWSVWKDDFFPGWNLTVESRQGLGTSFVAACSPMWRHIVWFATAEEVRKYASQLGMHWTTYVRVVMAHELGHAVDRDLENAVMQGAVTNYVSDSTMQWEINAYANGRAFVSKDEVSAYERMNERNLLLYGQHKKANTQMFGLAMDETSVAQLTAPAFPNTSMSNLYVEDIPTLPLWVFAKQGKSTQMASFLNKPHHFCHVSHTEMQLLFKMAKGTNIDIMRILDRANPAPNKEMNKRVFISFDRNIGQRSNQQLSDNREQIIANVALKLKGKQVKIYTANSLVRKIFLENGVHCFHTDFDVLSEVGNFVHLFVMNSQNKSSLSLVTRSLFMGNRIVPAYY